MHRKSDTSKLYLCNEMKRYSTRRSKPTKGKSGSKLRKTFQHHKVVHKYTDHATDEEEAEFHVGKNKASFPRKLHELLSYVEIAGLEHIVSWQPHGRCFKIHKKKDFVVHVLPSFFRQKNLTSFQRQLNLYGFNRITQGNDSGGYYHEYFVKGRPGLCNRMFRTSIKGTYCKGANNPVDEPYLYHMPPVRLDDTMSPKLPLDTNTIGPRATHTSFCPQFVEDVYSLVHKELDILALQDMHLQKYEAFNDLKRQQDASHRKTETMSIDQWGSGLDVEDDDSIADYESLWWMEINHNHDIDESMMENSIKSEHETSESKFVFTLECLLLDD